MTFPSPVIMAAVSKKGDPAPTRWPVGILGSPDLSTLPKSPPPAPHDALERALAINLAWAYGEDGHLGRIGRITRRFDPTVRLVNSDYVEPSPVRHGLP
jgi:hypothetical protein